RRPFGGGLRGRVRLAGGPRILGAGLGTALRAVTGGVIVVVGEDRSERGGRRVLVRRGLGLPPGRPVLFGVLFPGPAPLLGLLRVLGGARVVLVPGVLVLDDRSRVRGRLGGVRLALLRGRLPAPRAGLGVRPPSAVLAEVVPLLGKGLRDPVPEEAAAVLEGAQRLRPGLLGIVRGGGILFRGIAFRDFGHSVGPVTVTGRFRAPLIGLRAGPCDGLRFLFSVRRGAGVPGLRGADVLGGGISIALGGLGSTGHLIGTGCSLVLLLRLLWQIGVSTRCLLVTVVIGAVTQLEAPWNPRSPTVRLHRYKTQTRAESVQQKSQAGNGAAGEIAENPSHTIPAPADLPCPGECLSD